jgi:hypothetical protein
MTSRSDSFLHLVRVLDCVLSFKIILLAHEAGRTTVWILGFALEDPRTVLHSQQVNENFLFSKTARLYTGLPQPSVY